MNWYSALKLAMPLDPNAHSFYGPGQIHRLPQHSGFDQVLDPRSGKVRNVPSRNQYTPEQQAEINELYSGVHATQSPELAAVYANNNATPDDPPVILGFISDEQWQPDADAFVDPPDPRDWKSTIEDLVPNLAKLARMPFNPETAEEVMTEVSSYYPMEDHYETGNDLLNDLAHQQGRDGIQFIPQFYEHYYGAQALEHFWHDFIVPVFSMGGTDPKLFAYAVNQMKFKEAIPDEKIVMIGTTERFNTDYADDEEFDPTDWDEEFSGPVPEVDDRNRRIQDDEGRLNVYYGDDEFTPHVQWVWKNPQIANNAKLYYHGTVKSRALQALPQHAAIIQQIK